MTALRLIPALALGVLLATQADAQDAYHLSTHGDWDVVLDADPAGMSCAASTQNRLGEVFDLTIKQSGEMQLYLIFEGQPGFHQLDVDIIIEGVQSWELDGVMFTEFGAVFTFPSANLAVEFMVDLQVGRSVGLAQRDETDTVGNFSLNGSRDAIDGLFDCYRRISGVAA